MPDEQTNRAKEKARDEVDSSAPANGGSRFGRKLAIPVVAGAAVAAVTIAVRRGGTRVKEVVANADVDELPEKASRALDVAKDRLGELAGRVPPVADNLRELLPVGGDANGRGRRSGSSTTDGAPVYRNADERDAAQKEREARRAERRQRARA